MTMRTALSTVLLAAVVGSAALAFSQADVSVLASKAFRADLKEPVPFNHDQHNEKAKLADCAACHHGEKDGKLDPKADSVGTSCAECHPAENPKPGRTGLMRAYHRQCAGCHESKGKGPLACGQCHKPV